MHQLLPARSALAALAALLGSPRPLKTDPSWCVAPTASTGTIRVSLALVSGSAGRCHIAAQCDSSQSYQTSFPHLRQEPDRRSMCPLCKGQAWSVPHQMHAPPRGLERARYSSYQPVFPPNLSLYSHAPPAHKLSR